MNAAASDPPVLRGTSVSLRPATGADAPALHAILETPEVASWWSDTVPRQLADLESEIEGDGVHTFVIEVEGATAGMIQYHEETDPQHRSAGIDVALAPAHLGRGLGTDAVRTLAKFLFDARGHHRLTIDPAATNLRAIASYRKVGFQPVGLMRQYERGPDGVRHDGLLMDLLRDELVR